MKPLTPAEARAILSVLQFAWADIDSMNETDRKSFRLGKRVLKLAYSGHDKLRAIAREQK